MFIYNVTVNIEDSVHEEWVKWMREEHMPEVMQTGCFSENRMVKVLNVEDAGQTYSMQYHFSTMEHIEKYKKDFAPKLQASGKEKFKDKFVAFRTILQIID